MTMCLGKSSSYELLCVSFVNLYCVGASFHFGFEGKI